LFKYTAFRNICQAAHAAPLTNAALLGNLLLVP